VAVVDPGVGGPRRLIGLEANGHVFVGPDNGIFWPVIQDFKGATVYHLTETRFFLHNVSPTFHGREIFSPVAAHLSTGVDLKAMGPTLDDPVKLDFPIPRVSEGALYGQIIRVDNFGNLITNIHSKKLARFLEMSQPVIELGNLTIKKLSKVYSDVEEGEPLALVSSSNWLEIAVNLGRASEYIGVDPEETIGTIVKVVNSRESL